MSGSTSDRDLFQSYSLESYIPVLAAINDEVNKLAITIETHFVSVAASINEALQSTPWLPDYIKPPRRAYSPGTPVAPTVPVGYMKYSQDWIDRHRALTAGIVAFVGTGAFIIWRQRRRHSSAKRRARRAKNGSRTEVVVLAGSPYSPLTRSLSLDLERRGFIVYIPVSNLAEERLVQSESRSDIRPLNLDISSPIATATTISKFETLLSRRNHPLPHTPSHTLHLTSLLLLPPATPPTSPISSLHPVTWSDTLTSQLIAPFTILHAFLPLLTAQKSSLLVLSPSIVPSLMPAMHGLENVVAAGMQAYVETLRKEITTKEVNVVQLRLGIFDYYSLAPIERSMISARDNGGLRGVEHLREESARGRYAKEDAAKARIRGASLRELHVGVFDAIVGARGSGGTIFVGKGSRAYDLISRWVPSTFVGWMVGDMRVRARDEDGGDSIGSVEWEKVETGLSEL